MFNLTEWKQTKFYQEAKEEGKLGSSVIVMQWTGVIRDGTLIEKGI
jgi:hypothetical protein